MVQIEQILKTTLIGLFFGTFGTTIGGVIGVNVKNPSNKILGFIVGLIEGYIIVFLALNILAIPLNGNADFANSNLREFIMNDTPVLSDSFGGINHALDDILSLEGQDVDANNLTVIDTLLKYKVVSVDFVEELVETGKLQDVDGLDAVLDKYR